MNYLIINITKQQDGTVTSTVETSDNQREADSIYYGMLQNAALSELPLNAVSQLDETGNCVKHEFYAIEEEPTPVTQNVAEMSVTSLVECDLDLYNSVGELIPNQTLAVPFAEEPQSLTYMFEAEPDTYHLKNSDGYALGLPSGEIKSFAVDGSGETINLGSVEVIMLAQGENEGMEK